MTIVRDSDGTILPCCWDDCERSGHDQIQVRIRENESNGLPAIRDGIRWIKTVKYIFCSDRHKEMWLASTQMYGSLPTGSRGLIR